MDSPRAKKPTSRTDRNYKAIRVALSVAAGSLLTRQAAADDPPAWDVLQEATRGDQQFVVGAFQTDDGVQTFNVRPSGLQPAVSYVVRSVDAGVLGEATGAELMANASTSCSRGFGGAL